MFILNAVSSRLANIFVGIALGVGLVILYLTFLMAFSDSESSQMVLLPLSIVTNLKVTQ
jgi:hypothetical protein